jgi:EAL domain-containing protein (putative c-di-GMP-specific phosphodiesterase class I)
MHISQRLRCALGEDSLKLVYQPQFDCKTRRMVGCEALLRWEDAELGSVPPEEFIRVAEDTGLIIEIGDWVLRTACQQNARWQAQGFAPIVMAVNLSSVQIRQGSAPEAISAALIRSGLAAQHLDVEITESVLMEDGAEGIALLERIKALGVRLSLDDFGTGYSSLSYLCRFPLDCLKIDRSFVTGINQDSGRQAIVSAILSLSSSLGLHVIAEGVETEEQLRFLTALGCDMVQGYLLGKPMSAEALARLLAGQDGRDKALVG